MKSYNVLTVKELSELIKLSKSKIYSLVENKEIPYRRIDGAVRFIDIEIFKWFDAKRGL